MAVFKHKVLTIGLLTVSLLIVIGLHLFTTMLLQPSGKFAYVTNSHTNEVLVVDLVNKVVKDRIPTGGPIHKGPVGIDITPDGGRVYVANPNLNNVLVINTTTNKVEATIPAGTQPREIFISPNGAFAYVTCSGSRDVQVISTESNTVVTAITVGAYLSNAAISPDGLLLFVTSSDNVSVIDTKTNMVTKTIAVKGSYAVVFTPNGRYAYVGIRKGGSVSVIDVESRTVVDVIKNVTLRRFPDSTVDDLAVSPDGRLLYVADANRQTLTVINTTTNTIITKMEAANPTAFGGLTAVAFSQDGRFAYLLHWGGIPIDTPAPEIPCSIAIMDTSKYSLVETIVLGIHAGAARMVIRWTM